MASGLLATGSYVFVQESRRSAAVERATNQTDFNLSLAESILPDDPEVDDLRSLLSLYERRGGFETMATLDDTRYASDTDLLAAFSRDEVVMSTEDYVRAEIDGGPYIVTSGAVTDEVDLRFLYSQGGLDRNLAALRNVLLIAWFVVIVGAGFAGRVLAKRTLQPVAETSDAAHSLAEGLLDTRLRIETDDEFGVLAASFNKMADALQGKIVELSEAPARERRFTSDVAHELRTPIAGLMTCASLLSNHIDKVDPPARRLAELIVSDIARLRALVEELMEIARLESDVWTLEREPIQIGEFVRQVVRANDWDERVGIDDEPVVLSTDPRRLERVVTNLVGNAIEHANGAGITVGVRDSGGEILVEVALQGPRYP